MCLLSLTPLRLVRVTDYGRPLQVICRTKKKKWSQGKNEERSQCEKELIETLVESYNNASHWSTRKQIPLKQLKHYIPGLIRYYFSMARHHQLLHDRGVEPSVDIVRRLNVDYASMVVGERSQVPTIGYEDAESGMHHRRVGVIPCRWDGH